MLTFVQAWSLFGVVAGFTDRVGGISEAPYDSLDLGLHVGDEEDHVLENRRLLASELGLYDSDFVYAKQVHGHQVAFVTKAERGRGAFSHDHAMADVDGLVTCDKQVVLTTLSADCAPVLFAGFAAGVIGTAHAGWRGATSGVITSTVHLMANHGVSPEELFVAIGPTICACCYEVDEPVVLAAKEAYLRFGGKAPELVPSPRRKDRYMLDIPNLITAELQALGVAPERILDFGSCTSCHAQYFSHRRDGGRTGRQAAFIYQKEE